VLMREEDGQPVLVDFGVGTYPDAPEITPAGMPPGTALYRSPEVIRARREQEREERYRSTPGDDLWSLGVLFYWLLTGAYPFEGRDEASLASAIADAAPRAPHERNPRVPQTVSEVCLRMLEKAPEARYPDARAVGEALEAALARADTAWEVLLGEAWGPDNATTPVLEELGLAEAMARFQRLGEYERQHLMRGMPESPREADLEPPGMREDARSELEPVEPPRARDTRPVTRGTWVLGMLALLLLLALWVGTSGSAVPRMPGDISPPGQEVAPPGGPLEGGEGATPSWHSTSAPVASATPPKDTRLKTPRHTSASPEKSSSSPPGSVAAKAGTAMLLCALGTHCSAPASQVRAQPPPEPCPAGALESMAALGIEEGDEAGSTFEGVRGESVFTIREGPGARVVLGRPLGKLLPGTVLLGHFVFNKERASGRFTEAQTPEGTNWHVCLEAWDWGEDYGRGLVREPGSPPGTAKVFASPHLRAVKQFK
jgi:serine/threonine protein kinase